MAFWRPDQIAYYPIPIPYITQVTKLIAELDGEEPRLESDPEENPPNQSPEAEWATEDLQKLLPLIQHNRAVLAVLDMTAAKPDTIISFPDACASVGLNTSQGRAGMGALTKLMKRLGKLRWPITYHWGEGGSNVAYYKMSAEMSERWLEVSQQKERSK